MINPRHLRAFVAVARSGSVARSADDVHRVQSAVTRAIQELEAGLHVRLFERRPHGMLLTEFGHVLLARAEEVFEELAQARRAFEIACSSQPWNPNAPIFSLGLGRQRLLIFVELMRQCHMGAVAESFGISQPAVSLALREVERGVGVPLVSRSASGIVPNALGDLLAVHVRRALAELWKAEEEIVSRLQGMTGHVVVGTLSLGRHRLLPQGIIRTTREHPRITVSTIEGSFGHLATLLRSADIDFILGGLRPPEHVPGLMTVPLERARIALIARPGHPFCRQMLDDGWQVLSAARWVLPSKDTWTRSSLEAVLASQDMAPPTIVVETADVTITRSLLVASDLITAASPHLFQHEIDVGELVVLPLELPSQGREIGIVQRLGGTPSVAARLLMNAIIEESESTRGAPELAA